MSSSRRFIASAPVLIVALLSFAAGGVVHARLPSSAPGDAGDAGFKVVAGPDVLLRSGPETYYYPVAKLTPGQILRISSSIAAGTGGTWIAVAYPAGVPAYVPSDSAEVIRGGEAVRLTAPSHLKAANLNYGVRGSWKPVLDAPLPAGSTLRLIEPPPAEEEEGAYLVEPPAAAVGWVRKSELRDPTPEELRVARASLEDDRSPEGPSDPAPTASTPSSAVPEAPAPAPTDEGASPPSSGSRGGPEGASGAGGVAGSGAAAEESESGEPLRINQSERGKPDPDTAPPPPGSAEHIEALEAAFEAARDAPRDEAPYDEVIEAFDRAIAAVEEEDVRRGLERRRAFLALQRDVRDRLRELDQTSERVRERLVGIERSIRRYEESGAYALVGRLTASAVYDGERLPRLYRIVSVGRGMPRTLGYVRSDAVPGLSAMLGDVVGVVGDAGRESGLNVVTPERVDRLRPAATVSVPEDAGEP